MLDMFEDTDRAPGDLNFGTSFLKGKSDAEIYDLKLKELNNGRLAMLAFSGMVHHNIVVKGPLFPLFPEGWDGKVDWAIEGGSFAAYQTGFPTNAAEAEALRMGAEIGPRVAKLVTIG